MNSKKNSKMCFTVFVLASEFMDSSVSVHNKPVANCQTVAINLKGRRESNPIAVPAKTELSADFPK